MRVIIWDGHSSLNTWGIKVTFKDLLNSTELLLRRVYTYAPVKTNIILYLTSGYPWASSALGCKLQVRNSYKNKKVKTVEGKQEDLLAHISPLRSCP